jgi:hypothetical protein
MTARQRVIKLAEHPFDHVVLPVHFSTFFRAQGGFAMRCYTFALLVAVFASSSAAALTITDKLTAYHAAGAAERAAVIPAALANVKDEIDRKGKSDADIAAEILPCMNSVDEQVSDTDRATQPVMDLVAVCLAQLGYKK